jgi:hypothetical protein
LPNGDVRFVQLRLFQGCRGGFEHRTVHLNFACNVPGSPGDGGDAGTKTSPPDLSLSSLCCEVCRIADSVGSISGLARARRKEQLAPPDGRNFVALIAHAQSMTCRHPLPVSNTSTKENGIHSCLFTEWVRAVRDTLMAGTVKSRKPTQQSDYGDEGAAYLERISKGTKAVPDIQATEYVAGMRGPSRRDLLRCDDGEYYVAKVWGSPRHVRILSNETLARRQHRLAQANRM